MNERPGGKRTLFDLVSAQGQEERRMRIAAKAREAIRDRDFPRLKKLLNSTMRTNVNLLNANLSGGDFRETNFTDIDLRGVDFRGANLIGAKITLEQIRSARVDHTTQMSPELEAGLAPAATNDKTDPKHRP